MTRLAGGVKDLGKQDDECCGKDGIAFDETK